MANVRISARLRVDFYPRLEDRMTTNELSPTEALSRGDRYLLWGRR